MLNSQDHFGIVTRLLHLTMAILLLALLALGLYIAQMQVSLANFWLYDLHKSFGLTALIIVIFRLVWHRITPPPDPARHDIAPWQAVISKATHKAIYLTMLATPLSGWIASAATGPDVTLFNWFALPAIAPVSQTWENLGFTIHTYSAYLMIGAAGLHMGAALYHHFALSDGSLRKMFLG